MLHSPLCIRVDVPRPWRWGGRLMLAVGLPGCLGFDGLVRCELEAKNPGSLSSCLESLSGRRRCLQRRTHNCILPRLPRVKTPSRSTEWLPCQAGQPCPSSMLSSCASISANRRQWSPIGSQLEKAVPSRLPSGNTGASKQQPSGSHDPPDPEAYSPRSLTI
ncbi:hypothetical protein VTI74DRAFT_8261 [Chaetomium olivicolor]